MDNGDNEVYSSEKVTGMNSNSQVDFEINHKSQRYPFCIVWTPIPLLTWLFPFIGHMGIATTAGVITDFAGPYSVRTDEMAFGKPTIYWQLNPAKVRGGAEGWDRAVFEASEEYKGRNHNLCFDNCHSHVAMALNLMAYNDSTSWNMVKLAALNMVYGRYVGIHGFLKTWLPFFFIASVTSLIIYFA